MAFAIKTDTLPNDRGIRQLAFSALTAARMTQIRPESDGLQAVKDAEGKMYFATYEDPDDRIFEVVRNSDVTALNPYQLARPDDRRDRDHNHESTIRRQGTMRR